MYFIFDLQMYLTNQTAKHSLGLVELSKRAVVGAFPLLHCAKVGKFSILNSVQRTSRKTAT